MKISKERLSTVAMQTGFRPEILEKVIRLMDLLNAIFSNDYLASRLALKGGTALNLFYFDLPRLSVDIDLNYIGGLDRETMLAEKPVVLSTIEKLIAEKDYQIMRKSEEHAGGKWSLRYQSDLIRQGQIEVDLNFISRANLWPIVKLDSTKLGNYQATSIPTLEYHDLIGGKLNALFSRHSSRDLFDMYQVFRQFERLDFERLRIAFVVYGATSRKDWRTISMDQINFEPAELKNMLLPMLRHAELEERKGIRVWANELMDLCRVNLTKLFPFNPSEVAFLDGIHERGIIQAELLTQDLSLINLIRLNPILLWKCQNVIAFRTKKRGV